MVSMLGNPMSILVAPDFKVFEMHNGFSGWSEHVDAIVAHDASN